jgi:hypothetical protein
MGTNESEINGIGKTFHSGRRKSVGATSIAEIKRSREATVHSSGKNTHSLELDLTTSTSARSNHRSISSLVA